MSEIRLATLFHVVINTIKASSERTKMPVWASRWLWAAGIYNLLWKAVTIAFPYLLFDLAGIERITYNYPETWQCVGTIVGVYGIGYIIAAGDPRTHWPIVLVGLLGKIFGPIGFVVALLRGTFPPLFGLTIMTNDLLLWIPFAMILRDAAKQRSDDQQSGAASRMWYVKETRINAPPWVVFRFHESPGTLGNLIPPQENLEVVETAGSLLPASKAVLRGRIGLLPIRWVAIHTEYDPPHLFADRQESGPFAWWYPRHRFIDDGQGGTILRDEVEYQAPLGLIGRLKPSGGDGLGPTGGRGRAGSPPRIHMLIRLLFLAHLAATLFMTGSPGSCRTLDGAGSGSRHLAVDRPCPDTLSRSVVPGLRFGRASATRLDELVADGRVEPAWATGSTDGVVRAQMRCWDVRMRSRTPHDAGDCADGQCA